jgi:hypothetical protein
VRSERELRRDKHTAVSPKTYIKKNQSTSNKTKESVDKAPKIQPPKIEDILLG